MFTVSLREMLMRKSDCNMRTAIRMLLENEFGHVMSRFVSVFERKIQLTVSQVYQK